jgi:putative transposase of IS4/5 family DUF4096
VTDAHAPTCGHHLVQVAALGPAVDDHVARLIEAHQVELTRHTLTPARPKAQPRVGIPCRWCGRLRHAGHPRRSPADQTTTALPVDTSDAEGAILAPQLPAGSGQGRPVCYPRRDVVDAIRYLDRTGCQWAALPADFPHPKLVSHTSWRRVALTVVRLTPYWR